MAGVLVTWPPAEEGNSASKGALEPLQKETAERPPGLKAM